MPYDPRLTALLTRRSTAVKEMAAPGPGAVELEQILRVATRVPDHGKLCPWRIVILRGEGALKLGARAAAIFSKHHPEATEAQRVAEQNRFTRAPLCLAVLSTPVAENTPVWEQQLSAGAVCMNLLHAAHALGLGGKWLTEWVAYDAEILEALGGNPSRDRIAGFVYLGSKTLETPDRERPELSKIIHEYK